MRSRSKYLKAKYSFMNCLYSAQVTSCLPTQIGSIATSITGSGNVMDSSTTWLLGSHSVSPVVVSLRPMTA